jgi:hypothetical protein
MKTNCQCIQTHAPTDESITYNWAAPPKEANDNDARAGLSVTSTSTMVVNGMFVMLTSAGLLLIHNRLRVVAVAAKFNEASAEFESKILQRI